MTAGFEAPDDHDKPPLIFGACVPDTGHLQRTIYRAADGKPPLSHYFGYRVAPYTLMTDYLSMVSDRGLQSKAPVKTMEIRPNNKLEGSDMLYQAICEVAAS